MADQEDVRRTALTLPLATEDPSSFRFLVGDKAFAWLWLERVAPKGPRVPNPDVLAVRVAGQTAKDALLALDESIFFTEPHYDGYPAVLIRLSAIDRELLQSVLTDAWRTRLSKRRLKELEALEASGAPQAGERPPAS
ncbi:MAG TPA: hypothetical protein VGJ71_10275 [Candidatus Limnocylindrales bacterium]|jgi:hypothetical protein